MKLLRMEFEGIGSFVDKTRIDFERLAAAGLFLIEGPTGSGKSTILDALVYALYGSLAGAQGDIGRLDSHLHDGEPYVSVDFEVDGRTYQVHRTPPHTRAKLRGQGVRSVNPKATLLRMDEEPMPLANGAKEVSAYVQDIIGLTKQQFASTMVLAQGEFDAFLDAKTDERAAILERIFGTQFYTSVETELAEMRRQANLKVAQAEQGVSAAVSECKGALGVELDPESDALEAIEAVLEELRVQRGQANSAAVEAATRRDEAEKRHQDATALRDKQKRKREALRAQEELTAGRDAVEHKRTQLADHARAVPVMLLVTDKRDAEAGVHQAQLGQQQAATNLEPFGETAAPTAERSTQIANLIGQLQAPLLVETQLDQQRETLAELRSAAVSAGSAVDDAVQDLTSLDQQFEQATEKLKSGEDLTARIVAAQEELQAADAQDKLTRQLLEKSEQAQLAAKESSSARELLQPAEERLARAEADLRADHAAVLAAVLVDGQPCMVCGSAEHPHPAPAARVADGEDLEVLRSEVKRLTQDVSDADVRLKALNNAVEELRAQIEPGDAGAQLQRKQLALSELIEAQAAREKAQETVNGLQARRQVLVNARSDALLAQQKADDAVESAVAALDTSEKSVLQARGDFKSVARRVEWLQELQRAVEQAVQADTFLAQQQRALREKTSLLAKTLAPAQFADEAAVEAAILSDGQAEEFASTVGDWENQWARVQAILGELAPVEMDEVPDVEGLAAALVVARNASDEASREVARLDQRLGDATPLRDQVVERVKDLTEVIADTDSLIKMADYATANRQEVTHRIRLSSFVLMRKFTDVVAAANDRLMTISEGRYQLVLVAHGLDKRGPAGLDLRIADDRTERERSVRSLSGGERFYVSLALALGLADVVRGESGGVELGTLFIDEGFGSLDSVILAEVMEMLEQVRADDKRVIGLISHVEILKERIDAGISVRRDPARPGVSTLTVQA